MNPIEAQMDSAQMAIVDLMGGSDMYNRMQGSCWTKCISNLKTNLLSAGESSCIDRCVNKYSDVHAQVGMRLQVLMEKNTQTPS
ncbi:putative mitochondrial import inner membrane translocase subunit TIM10 [Cardiosporidium cionae]|uniref:Mitochondrial import inner membrane translocase subunit n=1 Tax=Cardiosporidium cionae TaxID=476202 RepID=A0ABQ7J904_9APIC|nr:putative mitochondrial import inner membrane translocase subunit TIM10 [Cardiosporidium cionae]|eukprot:KAF8820479.1 putative mitochondrial import inner membrane translocase subunit TIM10 [Cardiosporidium cionae]